MYNLTGIQFGKWTAISRVPDTKNGGGWLCRCDCGTERVVRTDRLINGRSKSCGCQRLDKVARISYKDERHRLRVALSQIYAEATNPRLDQFKPEDYLRWFAEVARIGLEGDTDE